MALKIKLKENNLYFEPEKPYTPEAQAFVQQFAYALNVYRINLGIFETYSNIVHHDELQVIKTFKDYLILAQTFKESFNKEDTDLIAEYNQAKKLKKQIFDQLKTEKINENEAVFKEEFDLLVLQLNNLLEFGSAHLQNAYQAFPNNPLLWMFHDRSWHTLLKTSSRLLYVNQYTSSTLYGTLAIKKEFITLIKCELEQFDSIIFSKSKLSSLKIELLKEAAKIITDSIIDTTAKLVERKIKLPKSSTSNLFFDSKAPPHIYQLMATLYSKPTN